MPDGEWPCCGLYGITKHTVATLTKTRRRILFWLAVAVFLVAAPLLIVYSQGLRYDFTARELVRVGAIALDSHPEEAQVVLDGEFLDETTPEVLRGLLPGREYAIEVQLEGYHWWRKTLTVDPQRITAARSIHLFPVDIALDTALQDVPAAEELSVSGNGERIFGVTQDMEVFVYNTRTATTTPLDFDDGLQTQAVSNVQWHENNTAVLFARQVSGDVRWYVWNSSQNTLVDLNERYGVVRTAALSVLPTPPPADFNPFNIVFARNGETQFIVSLNGRAYVLNVRDNTLTDLGLDNVATLYGVTGRYFLVNASSTLIEFEADGDIVRSYGNLGLIPDRLLLSPNGQRMAYETAGRVEVVWLERQELDYKRERGDIDTVFSMSTGGIGQLWWHASSAYLIMTTDHNVLTVFEIDTRSTQNTYTWTLDDATALGYSARGSILWVSGSDGVLRATTEEF